MKPLLIFCSILYMLCTFSNVSAFPERSGQPLDSIPRVIGISLVRAVADSVPKADTSDIRTANNKILKQAFPGNIIRFTISNPLAFLKTRPTDQSRVVIFVNGVEMKGLCTNWYSSATNLQIANGKYLNFINDQATVDIILKRDQSTKAAWNFFYNNTANYYDNFVDVDASIGWEGMSALGKDNKAAKNIRIIYYRTGIFALWVALFVVLVAGFAILSFWTNAIREGSSEGAYSLSLTQLLFWTTLAIGAFIYTLVLTDITPSFNSSILYMLGISLTTTGVATVIDSRFRIKTDAAVKKPHSNFFQDVLTSDGKSFSIQRLQIFAWNLILGVYFIVYTIANKTMPEFSETLLLLAGFSSVSYLSAKSPENEAIKTDLQKQVPVAEKELNENANGAAAFAVG